MILSGMKEAWYQKISSSSSSANAVANPDEEEQDVHGVLNEAQIMLEYEMTNWEENK